jgi:hemoglobin
MYPDARPHASHPWGEAPTPYEELGGELVLRRLVDCFYDRIGEDSPMLRAIHPADDTNSRRNLFDFLSGWLGGPNLYTERKGHPRLRMRHLPFSIGPAEANEWIRCMRGALNDVAVPEPLRDYIDARLEQTAIHVINVDP